MSTFLWHQFSNPLQRSGLQLRVRDFIIYLFTYNDLILETNPQISVYEQGEWIDKGQYTAAVSFHEDIEWIKQKRDYIFPVCYVSDS